ncbi:MAG: hypothetical protein AVO33_09475 [delta proteobacterium ML8_F1]|nr:MAG: hypothetical protein AVO33_09475 [delta proteobacterium ML8_F1]
MKTAKIFTLTTALLMAGAILYGFSQGDFFTQGGIIASLAWGRVTLVDIYLSFFLFSGWVVYRETSPVKSTLLIVSIMVLGSLAMGLYSYYALVQSRGDWQTFWMGKKTTAN